MFSFAWPWAFALLFLAPLIYFLFPKAKAESAALRVPFFERAESAMNSAAKRETASSLINLIVLSFIWLMLITSIARPQWFGEPVSLPTTGRDLLVAVDISGSMETRDMIVESEQIPRILIVKYVVGEFLKRRESDRLGLILFGTNAYLQSPLTFDRKTVDTLLQETQLGFAGEKTAIGDAIGLAVKRLRDRPDAQRVLILLTDGANTAGEVAPRKAADLAAQANVKIYTVGVGADEMIMRQGLLGFNRRVNPSADLDEETLQYIADKTGGQYFRARNPQELELIYESLDKLEPVEQEAELYRPSRSLYFWPLAIAFVTSLLFSLAKLLSNGFINRSVTQ